MSVPVETLSKTGLAVLVGLVIVGTGTVGLVGSQAPVLDAWAQTDKLEAQDADEPGVFGNPSHAFAFFGAVMEMDGDMLAASTTVDPRERIASVYVYERGPDGWSPVTTLEPNEDRDLTGFGHGIGLDEDAGIVAVGDSGWDTEDEEDAGALYIFEETTSGVWEQTQTIPGFDPGDSRSGNGAQLGREVAVEETTIVAAAPYANDGRGRVHVFETSPQGDWVLQTTFPSEKGTPGDHFGSSVSLQADTLLVGAEHQATQVGPNTGAVHVFQRVEEGWEETTVLEPEEVIGGNPGGCFGCTAALSGDGTTAVVGALSSDSIAGVNVHDVDATANFGEVYVFDRGDDGWEVAARLESPTPDYRQSFGWRVAVNGAGDTLVAGAPDAHFVEGSGPTGSAYVFEDTGDDWALASKLAARDTSPGDSFGFSVGISGKTVAAGAPSDDNRRDGAPPVVDDQGTIGGCLPVEAWPECSKGKDAGSVYLFEPSDDPTTATPRIN